MVVGLARTKGGSRSGMPGEESRSSGPLTSSGWLRLDAWPAPADANKLVAVGKFFGQTLARSMGKDGVGLAVEDDGGGSDVRDPVPEVVAVHQGPERSRWNCSLGAACHLATQPE